MGSAVFDVAIVVILFLHCAGFLGISTYKLGLNRFAGISNAEFRRRYLGFKSSNRDEFATVFNPTNATPPAAWDWRSHKPPVVTNIKDQVRATAQ